MLEVGKGGTTVDNGCSCVFWVVGGLRGRTITVTAEVEFPDDLWEVIESKTAAETGGGETARFANCLLTEPAETSYGLGEVGLSDSAVGTM